MRNGYNSTWILQDFFGMIFLKLPHVVLAIHEPFVAHGLGLNRKVFCQVVLQRCGIGISDFTSSCTDVTRIYPLIKSKLHSVKIGMSMCRQPQRR